MRARWYVLASAVISVLLHLILLQVSGRVCLERQPDGTLLPAPTIISEYTPPSQQPDKKENGGVFADSKLLDSINLDNMQQEDFSQQDNRIKSLLEQEQLFAPQSITYDLEGVESERHKALDTTVMPTIATAPRPKIIEIDIDRLPKDRRNLPTRVVAPKLERMDIPEFQLPSLAPVGPLTQGSGGSIGFSVKAGARPEFGAPDISFDDDEGNGPGGFALPAAPIPKAPTLGQIDEKRKGPDALPMPFDEYVDIEVLVLPDKVGTGGYFQVNISPNASSDNLNDIPKDSLFIIDHSESISKAKLAQFKKGTKEALHYLNPKDRFNIVSFTSRSRALYNEFTPVNKMTREAGASYIDKLARGGMTDVFEGVAPFVKNGNGNLRRPVNIFLLTDGQSTVNIHTSDDFLKQIYGYNPGNVSIFPFSAGTKANRELLDFLGYLNRGVKCHVPNIENLSQQLVTFVNAHSSMIIMDLKFTVDPETGKNIFPRTLPHLYRKDTLHLYGRFNNINDELVLNLTGRDATQAKRDLVFRRRYSECGPAPASLAQEWAGQKILYLIATKTWEQDPVKRDALSKEIKRLAQVFQVYTPYK